MEKAFYNEPLEIEEDGSSKLDFTYIEDFTSGILQIIENKNSINQIFNITYGRGRPVKKLIDILSNYFPNLKVINKKKIN